MANDKDPKPDDPKDPKDPKPDKTQDEKDKDERDAYKKKVKEEKDRKQQVRDREEAIGPVRVKGDRPVNPRAGQLLHDLSARKYLRFQPDGEVWEEVDQHRVCGHWVRRGDPVEFHVHDCVGGQPPTVVFQCNRCESKYRVPREDINAFKFTHRECPTCATPWPEDAPRDAIDKDFR